MIWSLGNKGGAEGEYSVDFELINGDIDKVAMIDASIDIGFKPILSTYRFSSGRRVNEEFLPTKVIRRGSKEPVADLKYKFMALVVTEKLKRIIEAFDPQTHQFVRFTMQFKDGKIDETPIYWFIPNTRLFALHESSKPGFLKTGHYIFSTPLVDQKMVFKKDVVGDHHVFCTAEYPRLFCISDALKNEIEQQGCTGVDFRGPFPLA